VGGAPPPRNTTTGASTAPAGGIPAPRGGGAPPPTLKAIIWDFDGTLVDSPVAVHAATNAALAEMDFPPVTLDGVRAGMVLATVPRMAFHAGIDAGDTRAQLLNDHFYRHAAVLFPQQAHPFPGVDGMLAALAARGLSQAVVTNNLGGMVRETLRRTGLLPHLRTVLGDGDLPAAKPDPRGAWMAAAACAVAPAACAYIGDSAVDLATARAAGMRSIGVTWGTTARDAMQGFDHLVDRPQDMAALVAGLGT
jgi:phosphoglycolate phosphatase